MLDLQVILAGLDPSLTVVILDPAQDGVQQIADTLQGITDLSAIHIISHGDSGLVNLGSAQLSQDTLTQYQQQLASIGNALSASGDLLLYGCNVALGDAGQNFITALAGITGADVAASIDLTGSALLGGDWQLEATTGAIETATLSANIAGLLPANTAPVLDNTTYERSDTMQEGASTSAPWWYFNFGYLTSDPTHATPLPGASDLEETDPTLLGIAIVNVSGVTGGTVEYSTDGGNSWDTVDNALLSETNAMLFSGTDLLRYTPPADANGVRTITFHTWDGTGGYVSGEVIDLTGLEGGSGPFSTATATHDLIINAVNDAPVFPIADGKLTTDFGGEDFSQDVLEQADGKILVAGTHFNGTDNDIALVRYNADGTLDDTFGAGGKLIQDFGGDEYVDDQIKLQNDGSILIAWDNHMVRFTADGILADGTLGTTEFGIGGELTFVSGYGGQTILDTNDNILVAGSSYNGFDFDFTLTRYDPDGNLDLSFGTGGEATPADFDGENAFANEVTLQADGKILVSGNSSYGYGFDIALVRYDTNGNLDTDFGYGGMVITDFGSDEFPDQVILQEDGKILVVGTSFNGSNDDLILVRYNIDGSLDNSFSGDGKLTAIVDDVNEEDGDVILQEDGKILVTNTSFNGSNYDITLTRYTTNGSLDNSFSGDGKVTLDFGGDEYSNGAAVLKDGKILVLGGSLNGSDASFVVARYNTDGSLDTSFSGDGKFISNFGVNDFSDNDLNANLQKDGSLLVTASSPNGIDSDFATVRINTDGSVDTSLNAANTLNGAPTYEMGENQGVVLDDDVTIHDAELSALDDFNGASLTLVRSGGADAHDVFSADQGGTLEPLIEGNALIVDGNTIGTVTTNNGGTLTLSFESGATQSLVDSAMQQIAYSNTTTTPVSPVTIDWIFNDGNDGVAQGAGVALSAFGTTTVIIEIIGTPDADTLTGTKGDDIIDGLAGKDVLKGGLGNDTYLVDLVNTNGVAKLEDSVIELAKQGTDTLILRADDLLLDPDTVSTLTLGANLENIDLTDTGDNLLNVTGNSANNHITGNAADNTIKGGLGADSMTGGAGADTYFVDNKGDLIFEEAPELFARSIGGSIDKVIASVNYALADFVEDLALSGAAISATGNALDNTLTGNAAANLLNGGVGADTMIGGAGNDTYVVDDALDVITEQAGQGTDTVRSSISYNLSLLDPNLENLTLIGTAISATGNAAKNTLTGNVSDNSLDGGAGVDALIGGAGNDLYMVDLTAAGALQDSVTEGIGAGADAVKLRGTSTNLSAVTLTLGLNLENLDASDTDISKLNLTGNALNNQLTGNEADNILNGGAGVDSMGGGLGNDTYIVDNVGDSITEGLDVGIDLVNASVSYTLSANAENLTLTGTAAINGSGNELNNTLTGNTGANILSGGDGDDTYIINSSVDLVVENPTEGTDNVNSSVSYLLTANVENLTLTGNTAINGSGNELGNIIIGNTGANILSGGDGDDSIDGGAGNDLILGGLGSDTLTGGAGIDTFVLEADATDTITDIAAGDVLNISNLVATFTGAPTDLTGYLQITQDLINTADTLVQIDADGGGDGYQTVAVLQNVVSANIIGAIVVTTASTAILTGTLGADTLTGGAGNNFIVGLDGNDTINGGLGDDLMLGGLGDDSYTVNSSFDLIVENSGEGTDDSVSSSASYVLSANVENLTLTGNAAINATGNDLINALTGNSGNNILDGRGGADSMIGGLGNDTYVVDDASDSITEQGGVDTVLASITYNTLAADLENLTLTGSADIDGTGNAAKNTLQGNDGNNILDGADGVDALRGGLGNDTYRVDLTAAGALQDSVTEGIDAGTDTIKLRGDTTNLSVVTLTLGLNLENLDTIDVDSNKLNLNGNTLNNQLIGNEAENILNGGAGADSMTGGDGNDTYIVDNVGDSITEESGIGTGTDSVSSSVSYTLSANIENLTLTGNTAINGSGNVDANTLTGNTGANILSGGDGNDTLIGAAGNDTLNGGAGNDSLTGGAGNDTYVVDSGGDVVIEAANAGTDTVLTSLTTYTLDLTNLENLTYTGSGGFTGTGNAFGNVITGSTGNDTLDGGAGSDILWGKGGADRFDFSTALNAATNVDKIMDFTQGDDLIVLKSSVFTALAGVVTVDDIREGAGVTTAATADQNLIYNSTTGNLYYDADGAGGVAAKLFATIDLNGLATSHPTTLASSDFGIFA